MTEPCDGSGLARLQYQTCRSPNPSLASLESESGLVQSSPKPFQFFARVMLVRLDAMPTSL